MASLVLTVGIVTPQVNVANAQNATWLAEYFDNPFFIGEADFTEVRQQVDFNWGTGAPGDNFPADDFTVRISTDVFIPAGEYRFYLLADDGASVTLDFNQRIINTFDNPRPGDLITSDVSVTNSGIYHIQIDYVERDQEAYVYFAYESLADGASGPNFPNPNPVITPSPNPDSSQFSLMPPAFWTGQYYSNRNLTGFPTAIVSNSGLNFNWTTGSPLASIPDDNFSARWNASYNLDGGPYQVRVRADDGVRVYLDGIVIIDQFKLASGQTYTADIQPTAGNHTFTVEYFEAEGVAFIEFQLLDIIPVQATPTAPESPFGSFATVTAFRLNVRATPQAPAGTIITKISRNESYPVIGKNADSSWVQIRLDANTIGWISAAFANVSNLQNVPVTSGQAAQPTPEPQATPYVANTRTEVNMRQGPSTSFDRILIVPQNVEVQIIGRNLRATWWQIRYDNTIGWVSAEFAVIEDNANLNLIPITD